MSVAAAHVQARFELSQGLDPIFRTVDGSNCDHNIDVSTVAGRSAAYSLLRTRGLFRVAMAVPENRDFEVTSVVNPYGCNDMNKISTYRRPLPAANLRFLSAVMFDGRESSAETGTVPINADNYPQSLEQDLAHQAVDAVLGHAEGTPPGPSLEQQQAIVAFELGLTTAQSEDRNAGDLTADGAAGGAKAVTDQRFFIGINDTAAPDPAQPVKFNPAIFNIFDAWQDAVQPFRAAVARGQAIFNTKTFTARAGSTSTCGNCHNAPNAGGRSVSATFNIGVADPPGGRNVLDTSYLPVITICQKPALTTCVQTTDPGRAMVTGHFADVGKFKAPVLRGLAARAPYFHDGSARSIEDVVEFYDARFHIGLTSQEKSDLAAFLRSL